MNWRLGLIFAVVIVIILVVLSRMRSKGGPKGG